MKIFLLFLVIYVFSQQIQVDTQGNQIQVDGNKSKLPRLGYITDWNKEGYQFAKDFQDKFTHLSPAWFGMKYYKSIGFIILGTFEQTWVDSIKNTNIKLLPRFFFQDFNQESLQGFVTETQTREKLKKDILRYIDKYNFDGIVFEYGYLNVEYFGPLLFEFLEDLSKEIHKNGKELILVIPPPHKQDILFTKQHFDQIQPHIDYFSLNTYDYSHPGPLSPFSWNENALNYFKSPKVLLGINFYGYDNKDAITGRDFKRIIDQEKVETEWNNEYKEQYFKRKNGNLVFYPSKESIRLRVELANKNGNGVAIWELGQGLNEFYEVL